LLRRFTTQGPNTYQDMRYGYDPGGNVTAIVDPVFGTQSLRYDDLDRLISATGPYPGQATRMFGYDTIGNLTLHCTLGDLGYPASGPGSVRPHAVTSSSLGSYAYDNNGNLLTAPGGFSILSGDYDFENRPKKISKGGTTTDLAYHDLLGRVTKTVSGTTTTYVGRWYECTGGTCRKYIFAGDQRIAFKEVSTGIVTYIHRDHLGSSSVLTKDTDGTKDEQLTYFPFGQTRTDTDGAGTPISPGFRYKYTDQELDSTTGLYYYKSRYYDPVLGRFIQPDPIVPVLFGPQSLNPYSYVLNNPLRYTDPSGFQTVTIDVTLTLPAVGSPSGYPGTIPLTNPLPISYTSGLPVQPYATPTYEFMGPGEARGFSFSATTDITLVSSYRGPAVRAVGAAAEVATTGAALLSLVAAPEGPAAAPAFFGRVFEPLRKLFGRGGAGREITSLPRAVTGREPVSVAEQMVMKAAMEGKGTEIMRGQFGDPLFQGADWVKMQVVGYGAERNITVHYMKSLATGETAQYKFVTDPYYGPLR